MRVSEVFEGLWLVKKGRCKLIGNRFVIPHDTIPSTVIGKAPTGLAISGNFYYLCKKRKNMDLQTRKIQFIQEILRIKNENIIEKLEKILHQERKKVFDKELIPMTIEEFNELIDSAESDSENDRMYNAGEILKDIDTWK